MHSPQITGTSRWTAVHSLPPAQPSRSCRSPKLPPLRPSPPKPERRCTAQRPVRGDLPGAGAQFARARHFARSRQGTERGAQVEVRYRSRARSRAQEPGAQSPRDRPAERDQSRRRLSEPAKLNREVVLYSLETDDRRADPLEHRFARSGPIRSPSRAAPISRCPISSTPRTRSTTRRTPRPICRGSQQFATVLDKDTAEQQAQAARGFLAPGWSIDLTLGQMRKLRDVAGGDSRDGRSRSSKRTAAKGIAGDWQRRATDDRRQSKSIPRSTARSPRWSSCGRRRARATAPGACRTATRSTPRRCAQATTTNYDARRGPPDGPRRRSPRSAPSSTRSSKRRAMTQGTVGERLAALNTSRRRSSTRTPTPAAPS